MEHRIILMKVKQFIAYSPVLHGYLQQMNLASCQTFTCSFLCANNFTLLQFCYGFCLTHVSYTRLFFFFVHVLPLVFSIIVFRLCGCLSLMSPAKIFIWLLFAILVATFHHAVALNSNCEDDIKWMYYSYYFSYCKCIYKRWLSVQVTTISILCTLFHKFRSCIKWNAFCRFYNYALSTLNSQLRRGIFLQIYNACLMDWINRLRWKRREQFKRMNFSSFGFCIHAGGCQISKWTLHFMATFWLCVFFFLPSACISLSLPSCLDLFVSVGE